MLSRALLPLTLLPLTLLLAACGDGEAVEGRPATPVTPQPEATAARPAGARTYDLAGFTAVESSGPDRVEVRVGPAFSVRAEGPADVLDSLVVARSGPALTIARQREFDGPIRPATVFVTLPTLTAAALRGSGAIAVDRIAGRAFTGTLAGSGDLSLGRAEVGVLTLNVGGSGHLRLAGATQRLEVTTAGSGDVNASGLVAAEASVTVQGSGDVAATVNGPAEVSVIGSGDVDLGEGARCRTAVAGSGQVRCGG